MTGTGVALVAEQIRVDESSIPVPDGVGTLTLSVTAPDGRSMFACTAKPDDLDTYLTGAPYDVVVDLASGGKATTRPVPGTQQPAPPAAQPFWDRAELGRQGRHQLRPRSRHRARRHELRRRCRCERRRRRHLPRRRCLGGLVDRAGTGVWCCSCSRGSSSGAPASPAVAVTSSALPRRRLLLRHRPPNRLGGLTILPGKPAPPAAPDVPAWVSPAPVALSGAELAGPPTGGLVVEHSADGAEAVVSASEPPPAAPPPPEAGWYPGAAPVAAAGVAAAVAAAATGDDASSTPRRPRIPFSRAGVGGRRIRRRRSR